MKKEIKIGLTVMVGVLTVYLVLTWIKTIHFFSASNSNYHIVFQDVSGLKVGDPVTVFGLPSGNVEDISLENQGAVVTINLDEDITVKQDAKAEIRVKELMGGKMIALTPGSATQALSIDTKIVGKTSLDFSTAFSKAGEFMDRFNMEQIDSLIGNINKIAYSFAKVAEDLDSMDTGSLLKDISQSANNLNSILTDVEQKKIVRKIDVTLGKINGLSEKAEETMNSFGDLADNVNDKTLPAVDKMLTDVSGIMDDAEEMMKVLKDLMNQMQDQTTLIGKVFYDPEFAEDLDKTIDNLNVTLDHIRTKKIHVRMSLSKKQRLFDDAVENE